METEPVTEQVQTEDPVPESDTTSPPAAEQLQVEGPQLEPEYTIPETGQVTGQGETEESVPESESAKPSSLTGEQALLEEPQPELEQPITETVLVFEQTQMEGSMPDLGLFMAEIGSVSTHQEPLQTGATFPQSTIVLDTPTPGSSDSWDTRLFKNLTECFYSTMESCLDFILKKPRTPFKTYKNILLLRIH